MSHLGSAHDDAGDAGTLTPDSGEWRDAGEQPPVRSWDHVGLVNGPLNAFVVLRPDGRAWSWGHGSAGFLGRGTYKQELWTPELIPSIADQKFVRLVGGTGPAATCLLREDGEVFCWGPSTCCGQFLMNYPNAPKPIPELSGTVELDVAFPYGCAIRADAQLTCWGGDGYHIGRPEGVPHEGETVLLPGPVEPVVEDVTDLITAFSAACALAGDGQTYCWGAKESTLIGDQDLIGPTLMETLPPFTQLVLGGAGDYACGITTDDSICCFGDIAGQPQIAALGVQRPGESCVRVEVPEKPIGLALSHRVACVHTETRSIWCWGDNQHAQVGRGDASLGLYIDTPTRVALDGVMAIGVTDAITYAFVENGDLYAWGEAGTHLFGDSDVPPYEVQLVTNPRRVVFPND